MDDQMDLTKDQLEAAAMAQAGGRQIEDLSSAEIVKLMTIGQYLSDRGLAEIEKRGDLQWHKGLPCVPYASEHTIETVLTRP